MEKVVDFTHFRVLFARSHYLRFDQLYLLGLLVTDICMADFISWLKVDLV